MPVCRNQTAPCQSNSKSRQQGLQDRAGVSGSREPLPGSKENERKCDDCNVQFHDSSGIEMITSSKEDNYYDENIFVQTNCLAKNPIIRSTLS